MSLEKIEKADKLIKEGKAGQAVALIKEAIKESPNDPFYYYLLGTARIKSARLFLAKEAFLKANELLPRNAENLRALGWSKIMLDEIEEGRKDLREAISLDLMNYFAYADLAMSYFNYFDFKEGMDWLNRAIALSPKDPFILQNLKIAKEMQKQFSKVSEKQLEKMRKEKSNPNMQRAFRLSLLEQYSNRKALTRDEAEEMQKESRFNGVSASIVTDKQQEALTLENKSDKQKLKEFIKRRKEIEEELQEMLDERKSKFDLNYIKKIIYNEQDDDCLMQVVSIFDRGGDASELDNILEIVNDAWNYFPHKCLGGLCPMEKIVKENKHRRI
ncbi:MAG: hypothetical protein A2358_04265 [Candidatus Staskawiczbacteria bacterium RIFOXYB1_FULL_37_44]|uniref:Uncharacterized protein n=1 Tax=Candidatus Staskawiczbacteria bacterium RIFOXYB1_FULL_37_44 TaxID=1802223 RepID=A0A1G2IYG9_9BACT|nr:MAG: hypothetical protein A2358_04265 [Candidatus Staskawiczbacteria bacterium RIFOXYB1_FULL_37_44]OGZ83531.1 MAG: hypothetical protein A2416_01210 [Candidatus Staskawiczbacteria bacterium RIFOXYC1_FULL_37_52]OGZ88679.1 MAG: hypothetical protein A2444_02430 [Candidatus Staskawiczbacteria bacterium RIFOXYC2_FULL_37_19]